MNPKQYIKKASIVALLVMGIQMAYAAFSFTGIADEKLKTTKFSLKNLSAFSHKGLTFSSMRASLQYKGPQTLPGSEGVSMLRFDNGNTSYVYPYKMKVKTPKFKTPTPQQH